MAATIARASSPESRSTASIRRFRPSFSSVSSTPCAVITSTDACRSANPSSCSPSDATTRTEIIRALLTPNTYHLSLDPDRRRRSRPSGLRGPDSRVENERVQAGPVGREIEREIPAAHNADLALRVGAGDTNLPVCLGRVSDSRPGIGIARARRRLLPRHRSRGILPRDGHELQPPVRQRLAVETQNRAGRVAPEDAQTFQRARQELLRHLETPALDRITHPYMGGLGIEDRAAMPVARWLFGHHVLVSHQREPSDGLGKRPAVGLP